MAVTRYQFPDRAAIESVATVAETLGLIRGAREIRRAAERPGRNAELTAEEAVELSEHAEDAVPRVREILREKGDEARAAIEYDRVELQRRRDVMAGLREKHGYR